MITWKQIIDEEKNKPYWNKLQRSLEELYQTQIVYPPKQLIFKAFELTPLHELKAVILGQDCYHGESQACGLAFSVQSSKLPPSLKNIFKELASDLNTPMRNQGDLSDWACQGVLLLNSILTVEKGRPASHKNIGWEIFTSNIISRIDLINRPIAHIIWGNFAQEKSILINNPLHKKIISPHPSPFSAHKGFFGSKPFSQTNDFLNLNHVDPIEWNNQALLK